MSLNCTVSALENINKSIENFIKCQGKNLNGCKIFSFGGINQFFSQDPVSFELRTIKLKIVTIKKKRLLFT